MGTSQQWSLITRPPCFDIMSPPGLYVCVYDVANLAIEALQNRNLTGLLNGVENKKAANCGFFVAFYYFIKLRYLACQWLPKSLRQHTQFDQLQNHSLWKPEILLHLASHQDHPI